MLFEGAAHERVTKIYTLEEVTIILLYCNENCFATLSCEQCNGGKGGEIIWYNESIKCMGLFFTVLTFLADSQSVAHKLTSQRQS